VKAENAAREAKYKELQEQRERERAEELQARTRVDYGEHLESIQHLEAALHARFESLCDELQPPMWPNLPIRTVEL